MSDIGSAKTPAHLRATIMTLIILAIGVVGEFIKAPFGRVIVRVTGHDHPHPPMPWLQWFFFSEWGLLTLGAIGTLLFARYSGIRPAPFIERLLFRDPDVPKTRVLVPGFLGGLAALVIFIALSPLAPKGPSPMSHLSHADMVALVRVWPLGFIGAGLSEEVVFRFGIITTLLGLSGFIFGRSRWATGSIVFWVVNLAQGFFFGLLHVQAGIVASSGGHIVLATFLAAQSWVGIMLGFIYRRWGIEAGILTHMTADFLVPLVVFALPHLQHLG